MTKYYDPFVPYHFSEAILQYPLFSLAAIALLYIYIYIYPSRKYPIKSYKHHDKISIHNIGCIITEYSICAIFSSFAVTSRGTIGSLTIVIKTLHRMPSIKADQGWPRADHWIVYAVTVSTRQLEYWCERRSWRKLD